MRHRSLPSRRRGFTLIELMVTVALVAVVSTLAAPSFRELMAAQRTRSAASAFVESLWLARSEAIKRNAAVGFSMTSVSAPWQIKAGATVLREAGGVPSVAVTYKQPPDGGGDFEFNPHGRLASGGGSVLELGVSGTAVYRCISVTTTGRATVKDGKCPA